MSRRLVVRSAAAVVVAAVAAAVAITSLAGGSQSAGSRTSAVGAPTAFVIRRDLANTQDVDATLGFGDSRTVIAPVAGVVTAAPAAGAVVRQGRQLYALGGKPVVLLDGSRSAWRDLAEGMSDGADVRQLERDLVALGLDPGCLIVVDDHFTAATRAAIDKLQLRLGLPVTGALPLGSVVFLPGERRITAVFAQVGDAVDAGAKLLSATSSAQVATITLDTSQRSLVSVGEQVQVVLPDSRTTPGTIASVGATATQGQSDATGEPSSTVAVTVEIPARLGLPDGTPVTVRLTTETHRNVLSIPITALLATSGGRRAVEAVAADGSTRLVAVRTGLYAGGFVEISGRNVRGGMRVLDAPST